MTKIQKTQIEAERKTQIEAERIEKAYQELKKTLTEREKDIITRYYGIDKQVRHSLREIGEMYQVTRERIPQIKVNSLIKLKVKEKAKK